MRILLAFNGSRGDVQPGLLLGAGLAAGGHSVVAAVPPNLLDFAAGHLPGAEVVPLGPDTRELLASDLVRGRAKSPNPVTRVRALAELSRHGFDQMAGELAQYSDGVDAVVAGMAGQELAFVAAEYRQVPFAALHYCPIRPSAAVPALPGGPRLPAAANRGAWAAVAAARAAAMRGKEAQARARLGLPATRQTMLARMRGAGAVEVQAYDPALFPGLAAQWAAAPGPARPFTGFLTPTGPAPQLDPRLREWIGDGDAPVYAGFGSMPVADPKATLDLLAGACRAVGRRLVLAAGWSDLEPSFGGDVAVVRAADHRALFPLCAAAVHHGGAGSTGASVRAGLPTLVCWFSADQPYWGAQLRALGAGGSVRFRGLGPARLRAELEGLLRPETGRRARALAASMMDGAGAARAAGVVTGLAGAPARPDPAGGK